MSNRYPESCIPAAFASSLLAESYIIPAVLLKRYQQWGLSDTELILLLRLAGPILVRGPLDIQAIAAEFEADEDMARALVQPFVDNRMLELIDGRYTCDGLLRDLYQDWAVEQRMQRGAGRMRMRPDKVSKAEKEQIRLLGLMYRRFEQELGRSLKYAENERLRFWLDDEKLAPELIEEALKRAVLQNKCSFSYIDSILKQWQEQGLTSLELVEKFDVKPQNAEKQPARRRTRKTDAGKYDSIYDEMQKA